MSRLYEIFKEHPIVCTDSRKVATGALFFALRGENFDGNSYALSALAAGAAYSIVDDPNITGERIILVDNVLVALQELAREHRRELSGTIIAITGSNGKTTTKELLRRVLETKYSVRATIGNLNNHIGVPLTLLSFDSTTQVGIVEMGANHLHEIERLCSIAEPNIGLITNIGLAHLEGFGSAMGVQNGKGEMFDYLLENGGTAIFNAQNQTLSSMITQRKGCRAVGYNPYIHPLELSIYGDYNQLNAQAALAVGMHLGVNIDRAKKAIYEYVPDNNRSQIVVTNLNTLYMDAYNANPSSMRIAIDNFTSLIVLPKMVIIGQMKELGDYSESEHHKLVEMLSDRFDRVILVGENFERCHGAYLYFNSAHEVSAHFAQNPVQGYHILIKGSRGVGLESITEAL